MAKDLNKAQLTGHLGADPEMRYTSSGSAVTTFRVASNRSWRDRDGAQHEDTEWFRIVAWDKLGEICNQYLTKGTRVYIEGRIQTRKWTDRDGNDRYTTEIVAQDMIILSARGERVAVNEASSEYEDQPYEEEPASQPAPRDPAARSNSSTRGNGRSAARNQPQTIDNDDDIPF
jgi:single-strand DNA-binding protein